jgi:hypothetical protein
VARHGRPAAWSWLWQRRRRPKPTPPTPPPTWATEPTDGHAWVNAPTDYQPLVVMDSPIVRPYVGHPIMGDPRAELLYIIRECDG